MYKIIVVDWVEGSCLEEKEVAFDKFMEVEDELFDLHENGEDFRIGGENKNELWIKDNITCDDCLEVRDQGELEDLGGHCIACESNMV